MTRSTSCFFGSTEPAVALAISVFVGVAQGLATGQHDQRELHPGVRALENDAPFLRLTQVEGVRKSAALQGGP
jgi:hypothetical protein